MICEITFETTRIRKESTPELGKFLKNGNIVRYKAKQFSGVSEYVESRKTLHAFGKEFHSLSGFATYCAEMQNGAIGMKLKKYQRNGWRECEVLVDQEWIKMDDIRKANKKQTKLILKTKKEIEVPWNFLLT